MVVFSSERLFFVVFRKIAIKLNAMIKDLIEKLIAQHQPKTTEDFAKLMAIAQQQQNRAGISDFGGISGDEMHHLLYSPFAPESSFGFRDFSLEILDKCPLFCLAEDILRQTVLTKSPFKMTATGALPVKIVKSVYENSKLTDKFVESGLHKLYKESDCNFIFAAREVLQQSSVIRLAHGQWHLTKKGEKLVLPASRKALFEEFFQVYTQKFNWAYFDGFEGQMAGQLAFAWSLAVLHQFGDEPRLPAFYGQKYVQAFPNLLRETGGNLPDELIRCHKLRFFTRFSDWFGFLADGYDGFNYAEKSSFVAKTALLGELFRFPKIR
jgi:hypothetical protein